VTGRRGLLVVFEGAEGVGKSTQVRWLADRLAAAGLRCATLREPGGTVLGEQVRALLLDPESAVGPRAEALLFMAARAQLMTRVASALDQGEIVLLDRFFLSTYAYQVAGRGLPEREVREANRLATGGLVPDLTLLLTLPAGESEARVDARGGRDRIEQAGRAFHERVTAAFRDFAAPEWGATHPEAGPIVPVDASGAPDEVARRVHDTLSGRWPETFAALPESQ
jgi:dTMP kinase